jgi:hypothetical protein
VILTAGPWPRTGVTEPTVWAAAFVARMWPGLRLLMVDPHGGPRGLGGARGQAPRLNGGPLPEYVRASAASCDIADVPLAVPMTGTCLPADALAAADVFLTAAPRIGPSPAIGQAMAAGLAVLARDSRSARDQLAGYTHAEFFGRPLPIEAAKALARLLGERYA